MIYKIARTYFTKLHVHTYQPTGKLILEINITITSRQGKSLPTKLDFANNLKNNFNRRCFRKQRFIRVFSVESTEFIFFFSAISIT